MPDNTQIKVSTKHFLPLNDDLMPEALVYPSLNNESLLSIGQLCNNGCVAIFDKYKLYIIQNGKLVLSGTRNFDDGLWNVPFKKKDINNIYYIMSRDKNKKTLNEPPYYISIWDTITLN